MKTVKTFEDFMETSVNEEKEAKMYKQKLKEIAENAMKINDMLQGDEELESWVQDKITLANHNMDAILSYMNGSKEKPSDVMQSKPLFSKEN